MHLAQIVLLTGRERGAQGQFRQADDGVHGRTDLMAHVGQETALGLSCRLGRHPGLLQRPLKLLAFGDLPGHAQHPQQAAIRVVGGRLHRLEDALVPAPCEGQCLFVDAAALLHRCTIVRAEGVGQLLGHEVIVCFAHDVGLVSAEELLEARVASQIDPVGVLQPDQVGHGAYQGAQVGLALGEVLAYARALDGNAGQAG